jgi:hypothetical protein
MIEIICDRDFLGIIRLISINADKRPEARKANGIDLIQL